MKDVFDEMYDIDWVLEKCNLGGFFFFKFVYGF